MFKEIAASFQQSHDNALRARLVAIYAFLAVLNVGAWAAALVLFWNSKEILSFCGLAYGLGLRHAVDADHIAAIDNVTRKLMEQSKKAAGVGFFFSLGHSTVVILMCAVVAFVAGYFSEELKEMGKLVGTLVSAAFLLAIAFINFVIFLRIYRAFRAAKAGTPQHEDDLNDMLNGRGLIARVVRPVFRLVSKSWHMYPVGFLFGLGFDTSSEVALLGISAEAGRELSAWAIMILPLLFTAGMCLIDTTDGVVMLGAYGWAFVKPMRKLFYNMVITLVSFLVAVFIGGLELLSIIADKFELDTGIWAYVTELSESTGVMGYGIIGVMIGAWLVAVVIYKAAEIDKLDEAMPAKMPD